MFGPLVWGLDPSGAVFTILGLDDFPDGLDRFVDLTVEAAVGAVGLVKPQSAFYERHGWRGIRTLGRLITKASQAGLLVILDAKRGDVGSTNQPHAEAFLARIHRFGRACRSWCYRQHSSTSSPCWCRSSATPIPQRPRGRQRGHRHRSPLGQRIENATAAAEVMLDAGFDISTATVDVSSRESVHQLVETATSFGDVTADQDAALATTPTDELLELPMLRPDQVTDLLNAYQLAERGNSMRVMAEAIRWGKRGARINTISPGIIFTPLIHDTSPVPWHHGLLTLDR